MNFFEYLKELYRAGIRFAKENPRLDRIGHKLFNNSNSDLFEEIMDINRKKSDEFFEDLLRDGIKKGEIDNGIDVSLTAHILTTLNISLGELFYRDGLINMDDMELVEKLIYIIENGLKKD
ncbi:MAG: hypothetical protein ACOC4G_00415 [Bacillota bacterium]